MSGNDEFENPYATEQKSTPISRPTPPPTPTPAPTPTPEPKTTEKKERKKRIKKDDKDKETTQTRREPRVQMVKESKETLERITNLEETFRESLKGLENTLSSLIQTDRQAPAPLTELTNLIIRKSFNTVTYKDLEKLGLTYHDLGWEATKKLMKAKGIKRTKSENIAGIRVKLINWDNNHLEETGE
jgi:hypothetical protein